MTERADRVLIVGAGIIGIACAYYLRKCGYRVTIIEKDEFGLVCKCTRDFHTSTFSSRKRDSLCVA